MRPIGRVAIVTSRFPETHETFILREVGALVDQGVDCVVYSLKPGHDRVVHPEAARLASRVVRPGVRAALRAFRPVAALGLAWTILGLGWRRPVEAAKCVLALPLALAVARDARKRGVRHVHAHWTNVPSTVGWVAARLLGVPFSISVHGENVFRDDALVRRKLQDALFVACCTEGLAAEVRRRYLPGRAGRKVRVFLHGLPDGGPTVGPPPAAGPLSLLSVGRMVQYKGFDHAIEAARLLRGLGVDFRWTFVGDGPLRRRLVGQARRLGLEGRVRFVGTSQQAEIARLLAEAHALVVPSTVAPDGMRDGIPNVAAEAMAAGRAVVGTEVGGIPEIVLDNETGLLVPPADPVRLAGALARLARETGLAARLGASGPARVLEVFDLGRNVAPLAKSLAASACRPLRVVHVIEALTVGGGERALVTLLSRRDRSSVRPSVVCLAKEGAWAPRVRASGVQVVLVRKRPGLDLTAPFRIARHLRAEGAEVVHTHMFTANLWGRLGAMLAGVPVVVATEQSVDTWKDAARRLADRALARATSRLLAVAPQVADFYCREIGFPGGRIVVVPNAVEPGRHRPPAAGRLTRRALGVPEGAPVLLAVGRMVEAKGYPYLLAALARLAEARPDLVTLFAGDGPLRAACEEEAARLGLTGRVLFLGERDDVPALISACDCLVMSSVREGLPLVALEAMALGRAVVATDVGGCCEVVLDGLTGYLVPPRDPEALAGAIGEALADRRRLVAMGRAGRRLVRERFDAGQVARRTEAVYREAWEEAHRAA